MWPEMHKVEYLKAAMGSAVHTRDDQMIGVISEIRGDFFKIKTKWWQHNFWLRADIIHTAAAGERVLLNVDKDHLEDVKIVDVPPKE